jgi:hypothetical protein
MTDVVIPLATQSPIPSAVCAVSGCQTPRSAIIPMSPAEHPTKHLVVFTAARDQVLRSLQNLTEQTVGRSAEDKERTHGANEMPALDPVLMLFLAAARNIFFFFFFFFFFLQGFFENFLKI